MPYGAKGRATEQDKRIQQADEDRTPVHACLGGSSCKAGSSLAASMDCWNSF
jgi:hypothetical protein